MELMFKLPNYSKLQTSFFDLMKIILDGVILITTTAYRHIEFWYQ